MKDKKKRDYLVRIINTYLTTAETIMLYLKDNATDRSSKLTCNKSIREIEQAKVFVNEVKHIEILEYLYGTFIGNSVIAYSVSGKIINSKKLHYFDSENGFDDFLKMIEENKQKALEKEKKQKETQEMLKKAKEEGKKVEYVYDKETKTTRPMIIEDKPSAWYNKNVIG